MIQSVGLREDRGPTVSALGSGSVTYFSGNDSEDSIRRAVNGRRKRLQARNAGLPCLIAIGHPISSGWTRLDHFDRALYGEQFADPFGVGATFRPTGEFLKRKDEPSPFVGVLAFPHVGLDNADEPVLYHEPRSGTPLPAALSVLEQRRYDPVNKEIIIELAKGSQIMPQVGSPERDK